MQLTIPARFLKAAALIASTDQIRYILNSVRVEISPTGKALIISTDGRRLIAINATDEIVLESPLPVGDDYGINIPTYCLKSLPQPIGKTGVIHIESSDARIRFTGAEGLAASVNMMEGTYPKWRHVIPSGPDVLMNGIHWNAELVTGFTTVAKMLSREKSSVLHVHQKGENGPYIIKPELAGLWLGVLMPVRSDIDGSIPDWLTVASPKQ